MQLGLKRFCDLVVGGFALLACFPVLAVAAAAIKLNSPGPVFFPLLAAGLDGRPFRQWKLRTMIDDAREKGDRFETCRSDPRITLVGGFLRRWSIDELPQLWNVVRGEMSLVGPRPAFFALARRFSPEQSLRLAMRPGITGLAQIKGRNLLSWDERMQWDAFYVKHYSLRMDFQIIVRTLPVLFDSQGIYGKDGRVRIPGLG